MTDEPLEVLVVHKMLDGTFVAADTLEKLRIVKDGFKSTAEAEKFIEDFYLARGVIRPRTAIHRAPSFGSEPSPPAPLISRWLPATGLHPTIQAVTL